ncbi:hypothetical protein SLEP1_g14725 [Rubroshorea leprosula]|uniref:Uncharacterized protein n=1 Tax=Rubroshorea leprosula TaxID=152421 RepID=A0AAV5ISX9_9ROSI|nr:hypothetical protein SLEP1_g14725 [Rubroshorea leprosula]
MGQLWELADAIIYRRSTYVVERNQQQDPGLVLIASIRELVLVALTDLQGRYLMALPFDRNLSEDDITMEASN